MRAFVAGATGYTGREVVRALCARGVPTCAHVRSDSPSLDRARTDLARTGAEVDTTPWNPAAMEATLARIHALRSTVSDHPPARSATG